MGDWAQRLELVIAVLAIAAAVASAIGFVFAPQQYDFVVWIKDVTVVFPERDSGNRRLPFQFDDQDIESASVVDINVANRGSASIGSVDEQWQLTLTVPEPARMTLHGDITVSSERPAVTTRAGKPNEITLALGLMEPGAQIDLQLLVVDASSPRRPDLGVTTSLQGLPRPLKTHESLALRLGLKLYPWTYVIAAACFVYYVVRNRSDTSKMVALFGPSAKKPRLLVRLVVGTLAVGLVVVLVVCVVLGWAFSWFM